MPGAGRRRAVEHGIPDVRQFITAFIPVHGVLGPVLADMNGFLYPPALLMVLPINDLGVVLVRDMVVVSQMLCYARFQLGSVLRD